MPKSTRTPTCGGRGWRQGDPNVQGLPGYRLKLQHQDRELPLWSWCRGPQINSVAISSCFLSSVTSTSGTWKLHGLAKSFRFKANDLKMAMPSPSPHKPRRKGKKAVSVAFDNVVQSRPETLVRAPSFPLAAFLWPARSSSSQWEVLPLILMVAGLFRWAAGLWGYSGRSSLRRRLDATFLRCSLLIC